MDSLPRSLASPYYVSPHGSNGGTVNQVVHDGTSWDKAWKTVAYPAQNARAIGDEIHVGEGIYIETEIALAPGVSLTGAGQTKTILTIADQPDATKGKRAQNY